MSRPRAKKKTIVAQRPPLRQRLSAWLDRHWVLWMVAASLLCAVGVGLSFDPKPFVGGDNASYILLSKSLVHQGSLSEIWTPEARINTLYPFGFPLLLAPISLLGLPYVWYELIPLIAGLAALWLTWAILHRRDPAIAALIVLLLAVNPHFITYSYLVLSEMPFLLFSLLALWCLQRWQEGARPWFFIGLVAAAVFTNYIRNAGVALFAGVTAHLLINKRYRDAVIFLGACAVLNVPWMLRNRAAGTGYGYLDWLLMRDPYQIELGRVTLGELLNRLATNVGLYGGGVLPRMLFPALDQWGLSAAGWLVTVVCGVPAAAGWAVDTFARRSPAGWYLAAFLAMVLLWPTAWADVRLVLPMLPFLLYYIVCGIDHLTGKIAFKRGAAVLIPSVAVLLIAALSPGIVGWDAAIADNRAFFAGDRFAGYDPAWRSFYQAAQWAKHNMPQSAVVVSRKPSLFYLESERKTFCYPFTVNRDSVVAAIVKADYVMIEPVSGTAQRYLIPAIEPLLGKRFQIVYQAGSPPTFVLQVIKERPDAKAK